MKFFLGFMNIFMELENCKIIYEYFYAIRKFIQNFLINIFVIYKLD
jgi:hypothetical protein